MIYKKSNEGADKVKKTRIQPENKSESYFEISTTGDGKKVILRSKSNIDIYDLTWEKVYSY